MNTTEVRNATEVRISATEVRICATEVCANDGGACEIDDESTLPKWRLCSSSQPTQEPEKLFFEVYPMPHHPCKRGGSHHIIIEPGSSLRSHRGARRSPSRCNQCTK